MNRSLTPAAFRLAPLLAALCALVLPGFSAEPCCALVRHVPGQYAAIQPALDACLPGDSVLVAPGEYLESVVVRGDSIGLFGAGDPAAVRIRGFAGSTLTVDPGATGVRVARVTLRPAPGFPPISVARLEPGCEALLEDTVFEGGTVALSVSAARAAVLRCAIRDATIGLALQGAGEFTVSQCDISGNTLGVSLNAGAQPLFRHNRVTTSAIYALQISSYVAAAQVDVSQNWWGTSVEQEIPRLVYNPDPGLVEVTLFPACASPLCTVLAATPARWGFVRSILHK